MAGIKPVLVDLLTKLEGITVVNMDQTTASLYARMWNNQLENIRDGGYSWPRPAAFIEIVSPASYDIIGLGFRSADLGIRIHLIDEFYNTDGTFEQNLGVFDLRDQVIAELSQYCPTACGAMNCINEEQDYDHDNLYHYIAEFVCNFTDSKGSKYDPGSGNFDESANENLDLTVANGGIPDELPTDNVYTIPKQEY